MIIQSVDRPDVNGVPPKMQAVAEVARRTIRPQPVLSVTCDDNIMSSVWIGGSFDPRETWANGIFENSRYFRFFLCPAKNQRYYTEGEPITVELSRCSHKLLAYKFRKYTGTPAKVLAKINEWLGQVQEVLS